VADCTRAVVDHLGKGDLMVVVDYQWWRSKIYKTKKLKFKIYESAEKLFRDFSISC